MGARKTKKTRDRFWTAREIDLLREWQEQGMPGREQARRLERSYNSWRSAVSRYGLSGEWHSNYNPEIRAFIMDMLPKGHTQADIVRIKG